MDILIKSSDGYEINRWDFPNGNLGKVHIPGTKADFIFVDGGVPRPLDVGPDHFLATATVVDEDMGDDQKRGPEVVSVVGQEVTITRTAVDKDDDDYMAEWESEMAEATREMPDCVEAVINSMTETQLGRLDQVAKDHLANKEAVRDSKPEVPE